MAVCTPRVATDCARMAESGLMEASDHELPDVHDDRCRVVVVRGRNEKAGVTCRRACLDRNRIDHLSIEPAHLGICADPHHKAIDVGWKWLLRPGCGVGPGVAASLRHPHAARGVSLDVHALIARTARG